MTRITNSDQVLLLLRNHLERSARAQKKKGVGSTKPVRGEAAQSSPLGRIREIAKNDNLSERGLVRILISGLLAEEFGDSAVNDPKFQLMVSDVQSALERDAASRALVSKAVSQLESDAD